MSKYYTFKNEIVELGNQKTAEGIPTEEWDKIKQLDDGQIFIDMYDHFPGIKALKIYRERPM